MSAPLIYFITVSLDNFFEDAEGRFDWSEPSDEVHAFVNELFAPVKLHLSGRRNHDVMMFWDETDPSALEGPSRAWGEYWQGVDKIIYSTTMDATPMRRAQLRSRFDADEVRRWKTESDAPIGIGGGTLASEAARAGLLDELHLIVTPHLLGGGTPYLDPGIRLDLELLDEHRFTNGAVYLRYRVT